jgi:hypothetical protein
MSIRSPLDASSREGPAPTLSGPIRTDPALAPLGAPEPKPLLDPLKTSSSAESDGIGLAALDGTGRSASSDRDLAGEGPKKDDAGPGGLRKLALAATALLALIGGGLLLAGGDSDAASDAQRAQIQRSFDAEVAAGHLAFPTFDLSDPRQVDAAKSAIAAMPMPAPERDALAAKVDVEAAKPAADRSTSFLVLRAYDNQAEDGDQVLFRFNGSTVDVPLWKKPVTLVIPKSGPLEIQVIGKHDGNGGITVGIDTAYGSLPIPILREGEILPLTVR